MRHKFLRISAVTSARRRARRTWFSRRNLSPGVARVSVGLGYDCVEPPTAGDTLELVLAAILEGEAGSRHEILDGLRHEYLGGPGVSCHARADCHAEASDLAVDQLTIAWCLCTSAFQLASPSAACFSAEPTMSVNSAVDSTVSIPTAALGRPIHSRNISASVPMPFAAGLSWGLSIVISVALGISDATCSACS